MKKLFFAAGVMLIGGSIPVFGQQSSSSVSTISTSLKPVDANPYRFQSPEERNQIVPLKLAELNTLISENAAHPDLVKAFRETMWRYENAIIAEVSGPLSTDNK